VRAADSAAPTRRAAAVPPLLVFLPPHRLALDPIPNLALARASFRLPVNCAALLNDRLCLPKMRGLQRDGVPSALATCVGEEKVRRRAPLIHYMRR
jgi:hypothetical protein